MAPNSSGNGDRYIVEKLLVLNGVAIAELGGEIYVIPLNTMVIIGPGVPHTPGRLVLRALIYKN